MRLINITHTVLSVVTASSLVVSSSRAFRAKFSAVHSILSVQPGQTQLLAGFSDSSHVNISQVCKSPLPACSPLGNPDLRQGEVQEHR